MTQITIGIEPNLKSANKIPANRFIFDSLMLQNETVEVLFSTH
jgi:hypothetical protein